MEQNTTTNSGVFQMTDWKPAGLIVQLEWTKIEIRRGAKTITIDPDELFRALKGNA